VKEKDIANLIVGGLIMAVCILWPKKAAQNDGWNPDDHAHANTNQRQGAVGSVSNERQNKNKPDEHEAVERRYWKRQNQLGCAAIFVNFGVLAAAVVAGCIAWNAFVIGVDAVKEARRAADEAGNQVVEARRQVVAAEKQIGVQTDTEKRQLRAYVYVVPAVTDFSIGKRPFASVTIKNGGQTPAYDFNVSLNQQIRPFQQGESMKGVGVQPIPILPTHDGVGAFVYQNHEYVIGLPPSPAAVSEQEYNSVMKGTEQRFYVWGRLHYLDAFNSEHFLNFCFSLDGESLTKGTIHYCTDANDTDH
jgi:hypothetical protein